MKDGGKVLDVQDGWCATSQIECRDGRSFLCSWGTKEDFFAEGLDVFVLVSKICYGKKITVSAFGVTKGDVYVDGGWCQLFRRFCVKIGSDGGKQ